MINPIDLAWIFKVIAPYVPTPALILLGGSRANGKALSASDHDVLVMNASLEQALSLTDLNPQTGNKFDLILRDPPSLAWDIDCAARKGNATILHIATHSVVAYDPFQQGSWFQKQARAIYDNGPHPLRRDSLHQEIAKDLKTLDWLSSEGNPEKFEAARLSLTLQFARLALRATRHWAANGKVAARFLEQHEPELKAKLLHAAASAQPGDVTALKKFISHALPAAHRTHGHPVPYNAQEQRFPANPTVADAYHYCRINASAIHNYLAHPRSQTRNVAQDWLRFYHGVTGEAVSTERFNRNRTEYDFALGRFINYTLELALLAKQQDPRKFALATKLDQLATHEPDIFAALAPARNGNPLPLHDGVNLLLDKVAGAPQPYAPRFVPQWQKKDPLGYGLTLAG